MRNIAICLLAVTFSVGSLEALEQRTFYNADRSKSFVAKLYDIDETKKRVIVINKKGRKMSFPLSKISEKCQEYVMSKKDALAVARYIKLDFKEMKAERSGDSIPTYYQVKLYNRGKDSIDNIELRYTLHYRQGNLSKGGSDEKTSSGKLSTGKLFDRDTKTFTTEMVNIVRTIQKPQGGG